MLTKLRLRAVWVIAPVFLLLARPSVPLILAGLVVALLGVAVRGWAAGVIHKNKMLTTHGPYAFSRNPLYLGSFLIGLGFAIASGRIEFLVVLLGFFATVYGRTMVREEAKLERLFGEEYRRYRHAVPRFLPRLPPWSDVVGATSPARDDIEGWPLAAAGPGVRPPFQLGRYLHHREYQAVLGALVCFLLLTLKLVWS